MEGAEEDAEEVLRRSGVDGDGDVGSLAAVV